MPDVERRERQRQNFTHVSIHTAQAWADTFVSELNDTHVEAELRRKRIPPQLFPANVLQTFTAARHRLIILVRILLQTLSRSPQLTRFFSYLTLRFCTQYSCSYYDAGVQCYANFADG